MSVSVGTFKSTNLWPVKGVIVDVYWYNDAYYIPLGQFCKLVGDSRRTVKSDWNVSQVGALEAFQRSAERSFIDLQTILKYMSNILSDIELAQIQNEIVSLFTSIKLKAQYEAAIKMHLLMQRLDESQ